MVMIATMMGWKKDDEEDRAFWKQMRANHISVLNADTSLFGSIQRAYEQGELPGIMLGSQEQHIYWYNEEIDRRIGTENVPEALRIQQVLSPHASKEAVLKRRPPCAVPDCFPPLHNRRAA